MKNDLEIGYIFEVDLAYPDEMHVEDKDLPFAAEGKMELVTTF